MSEADRNSGFSFVELFVMGSILGLMILVTIPSYLQKRSNAQSCELAESLRGYSAAFQAYRFEHGEWPPDEVAGKIPPGMENRLKDFTKPSPVGGSWHWQSGDRHGKACLCLVGHKDAVRVLQKVDLILDNGDLQSGNIRIQGDSLIFLMH